MSREYASFITIFFVLFLSIPVLAHMFAMKELCAALVYIKRTIEKVTGFCGTLRLKNCVICQGNEELLA